MTQIVNYAIIPTYNVCTFWAQNNLAKGLAKLLLLLLIFVELVENWKPLGFFTIANAPTQDVFCITNSSIVEILENSKFETAEAFHFVK